MDDHKDQTSAQPADLPDRLLSRWVQSPGVIDLRHSERRYNTTAGFAAERLPLLDRLNARRGLEVQTPAGGQEFAIVRRVIENTFASQPSSAQSSQPDVPQIRAERLADSVADNSPSVKVRISRKPAQLPSSSSRAHSSEASVKSEASDNSRQIQNVQLIQNAQPVQSSQSPVGRVASPPPLMLQKKTIQSKAEAQDQSRKSDESQNFAARPPDLRPREAPASVPVTVMRLSDNKPIARAQETHSEPASTTSQRTELLVFRKVSEDSLEFRESQPSVIQTVRQEPVARTARDVGMSSLPLIKPHASAPHIQRQSQSDKETVSNVSGRSAQESATGKQTAQPVVIREMRDNTAAPSSMVWRKSARQTDAEPTAGAPLIARKVDSPTASQTPLMGNQIVAPQPTQQGGGINMGKVIQEVIRTISRNLEVERERRG